MRALLFVLALVVLTAGAVAPLHAQGLAPATATLAVADTDVELLPVSFFSEIQQMPAPRLAAIVGGGFLGGIVVDSVLGGGLFTVLGVLVGAGLGNEWYERGAWPFR